MNKITKDVKSTKKTEELKPVQNFMDGISFEMDPITTLKMVAASSIFGEPQYYRDGMNKGSYLKNELPEWVSEDMILHAKEDSSTYMERIIDDALNYDFGATLEVAKSLRNSFNMRLNPQIIMVRAAMHPKREDWTKANPGLFKEIEKEVMKRADEPASQLSYWLWKNKDKKGIPSLLKRSWADKLASLSKYQVAKYKNAELGIIDTVRVCHASSPVLDELMKTGTLEIDEAEKTWENLKSEGKTWTEILNTIDIPHMALLRNIRGIAKSLVGTHEDELFMKSVLDKLVAGVEKGKQFPYRYYTAYKMIQREENLAFQTSILEAIEKCLQVSLNNLPKLEGSTAVLSDNSGSAWETLNSEYGTVRVAEIGNLSAVLTAMRSDEGYVGVFGDTLKMIPILKTSSILDNLAKVNEAGRHVGAGTETGIWSFFDQAVENKKHWDNIFIYSDMQAGYGQLYCTDSEKGKYKKFVERYKLDSHTHGCYIDVLSLVKCYRARVYRDTNIYTIQTAGYNNNVLPQNSYRTAILYGWTGKEVVYADEIKKLWDGITKQK